MLQRLPTILFSAHIAVAPLVVAAQEAPAGPIVETASGPVLGLASEGVEAFLGLPYAVPPVGDLRWTPPAPVEPWSGARDATAFGATCAAAQSHNGPRSEEEDCLFLNVWRPAGTAPDAGLPVYVYIHGGALQNGSSNQNDMAGLVAATGIVGVNLNYRLGALGFLAHPALTAESGESGTWGLMDQQAALRWVRDNIAAFGGDPARVTIGGESAGGWSVCAHLVAPGSRGLFAGAIIQSGSCPSQPLAEAEAYGTAAAQALGCEGEDLACLRALPVGRLLDMTYGGTVPLPAHGTPFLPDPPREAIAAGDFAPVPVLIGATRDEGRFFSESLDQAGYEGWVRSTFGERADQALVLYPWPSEADEFTGDYLSAAIITDSGQIYGIGGCPNLQLTRDLAAQVPTYAYEFAHREGPGPMAGYGAYVWGAAHAAELPYLFPGFDMGSPIAPTFDEGEQALAAEMKARWGAFVTTGAPEAEGLAPWPAFNDSGQVLSLRAEGGTTVVPAAEIERQHNCAFWNSL
jgi:carboxylesterase type B